MGGLGVAGTFALAAVSAAVARDTIEIKRLLEALKEIQTGAARLNVGTDRFQDLEYAAKKGGSSVEALYTAYRKLAVSGQEALGGDKGMVAEFNRLGVSLADLESKTPDEIFHKIAYRMTGAATSGAELAAVIKTMGRSADELLPAMRSGMFAGASPFKLTKEDLRDLEEFHAKTSLIANAWAAMWKKVGTSTVSLLLGIGDETGISALVDKLFKPFAGHKFNPTGTNLNESALGEAAAAKEAEDERKVALREEERQRERLVHLIERQRELNEKFFEGGMTGTQKLANLEERRNALLKETFDRTTDQGAADAQERDNKLTGINTEIQTTLNAELAGLRHARPDTAGHLAGSYVGPADPHGHLIAEIEKHVKAIAGKTHDGHRQTIGGF